MIFAASVACFRFEKSKICTSSSPRAFFTVSQVSGNPSCLVATLTYFIKFWRLTFSEASNDS